MAVTARLAVVLDDYGLNAAVEAAAFELLERGRICALSCQVGAPAWRAGAPALRALPAGSADLGLHLDLTQHPLQEPPRRLAHLIVAAAVHALDAMALRAEIRRQLGAFEDAIGRPPDHIDGHQHVHQLPQVREALLEELMRRSGRKPWLRDTRRPPGAIGLPDVAKAWAIEKLGSAGLRRLARAMGFATNHAFVGVYGFDGGSAAYLARLQRWLALAADLDVLVTHAARHAHPGDVLGTSRVIEFQVLAGEAFGVALRDRGLQVMPLSRCYAPVSSPDCAGTAVPR